MRRKWFTERSVGFPCLFNKGDKIRDGLGRFLKRNIPHNKKIHPWITCHNCGEGFFVAPYRRNTAKYCSYSCSNSQEKGPRILEEKNKCNYSREFKKIRIKIIERDENICQKCGKECTGRDIACHHIDKNTHNNNFNNLITVCAKCHKLVHKKG